MSRARRTAVRNLPQVYLRPPAPGDRDEYLRLNRLSVDHFRGLATPMREGRVFSAWLARCERDDQVGFLICREEDDAIAGSTNVSQIVRGGFQSGYLGYQVFAPFAGQGYMTVALPLILRVVFRELKLHRVEANIQPRNAASIALVRRAGFEKEGYSPRYLKIAGRWRDHERWAMTAERYRDVRR
ncbi:MAG: GNAT family N-acetyltransferase [Acidobacteria bacterium]|nr:GNAT family N-acetyltransferase [Acidobacteriota bacterium]